MWEKTNLKISVSSNYAITYQKDNNSLLLHQERKNCAFLGNNDGL